MSSRPAAFLDRDGVINVDHGYVATWGNFEFLPGVESALQRLQALGYLLIVVTNQSGIGRGYYSETDFLTLTEHMTSYLKSKQIVIAGVYYCPHHPDAAVGEYRVDCECRKPKSGLLRRAAQALDIDLSRSIMVGDKPSDMAAARTVGVSKLYLVTEGETPGDVQPVRSLLQVAEGLDNEASSKLSTT